MEIKNINKEFMNLYFKKKLVAYDQIDNKILLTDSYRLYILKDDDFILDKSKLRKVDLSKFINDEGYILGYVTNDLKFINKDIIRVIKSSDDSIVINVNDNYLKYFDRFEIKVKSDHDPVYIYENDEMVGLVLPIKEY